MKTHLIYSLAIFFIMITGCQKDIEYIKEAWKETCPDEVQYKTFTKEEMELLYIPNRDTLDKYFQMLEERNQRGALSLSLYDTIYFIYNIDTVKIFYTSFYQPFTNPACPTRPHIHAINSWESINTNDTFDFYLRAEAYNNDYELKWNVNNDLCIELNDDYGLEKRSAIFWNLNLSDSISFNNYNSCVFNEARETYCAYLDSVFVNGTAYYDVYKFFTSQPNNINAFYYAKNYGFIKIEYTNGNTMEIIK